MSQPAHSPLHSPIGQGFSGNLLAKQMQSNLQAQTIANSNLLNQYNNLISAQNQQGSTPFFGGGLMQSAVSGSPGPFSGATFAMPWASVPSVDRMDEQEEVVKETNGEMLKRFMRINAK